MILMCYTIVRYFGAARDLPGVRELFQKQREFVEPALMNSSI